jgi:hypothetical protein
MIRTSLISALVSGFIIFGLQFDLPRAASIEDVLTSLKGLSAKERLARVESEARKEGRVHWASSTPQAWAEPALQIFRKRYPVIQVEYRSQSGRVLAERVIREHRAGKYDVDVVGTSIVTFAGMKDSRAITPYLSPEAAQIRSNMKDVEGWWLYFEYSGVICNKNRVASAPMLGRTFSIPSGREPFRSTILGMSGFTHCRKYTVLKKQAGSSRDSGKMAQSCEGDQHCGPNS